MAASASLLNSTAPPVGGTPLRCPAPTPRGGGDCGRLLGYAVPPETEEIRVELSCPRCHRRTAFTIEADR